MPAPVIYSRCCMCGDDVTTRGWSVCDACHEKGRVAMVESRQHSKGAVPCVVRLV